MQSGPEGVPVGEPVDGPGQHTFAPPRAGFGPPAAGPLDEPPPPGVGAPAPSGRIANGFWPVPCLLVADDGGARLRIPVAAGTSVHAVVAATVRSSAGSVVEIETLDGRRFRYAPVADMRVVPGELLKAGAVLGRVAGEHAAHLELSVREPDGRWVDPYPLLVGLADPNELGVDSRTGDGIDPDAFVRTPSASPTHVGTPPAPEPKGANGPQVVNETPAAPPPPPPPPPPPEPAPPPVEEPSSGVSADILAAMIAPSPPPRAEPADE